MTALQLAGAERQHRAEEQPHVPSKNRHGRQWLCCLPLLGCVQPWTSPGQRPRFPRQVRQWAGHASAPAEKPEVALHRRPSLAPMCKGYLTINENKL